MTIDTDDFDVNIFTEGEVPDAAEMRAIDEIRRLSEDAPRPVTFARVKLIHDAVRATEERYLAQGVVDMSGTLIRAQVAAPTMSEAVDAMIDRAGRQIRRVVDRSRAARERPPQTEEGEWRHGDLPTRRPSFYPRPAEERQVLRRKTYGPEAMNPETALFNMTVLDFGFYLFTNSLNGEASVVYQDDEGGLWLRQASGGEPGDDDTPEGVDVNPTPAAALTIEQAEQLLDSSRDPFVFFVPPADGQARVLYRRYDGHYGLVEPRR